MSDELSAADVGQPGCPKKRAWEKKYAMTEIAKSPKYTHPGSCCGIHCSRCLVCAVNFLIPNNRQPCTHCPESATVLADAQLIVLSFNQQE